MRKATHTHYFGASRFSVDAYSTDHPERPKTKAEAQRLINGAIVSVSRSVDRTELWKATSWDGESWLDEFFCNNDHARQFAYAAARSGLGMPAYHAAVASPTSA